MSLKLIKDFLMLKLSLCTYLEISLKLLSIADTSDHQTIKGVCRLNSLLGLNPISFFFLFFFLLILWINQDTCFASHSHVKYMSCIFSNIYFISN